MKKCSYLMAAIMAFALGACGGGGESAGTAPILIPPTGEADPSSALMAVPTTSVSIQTYERLPTVSYPSLITSSTATLNSQIVSVQTPGSVGAYSQIYVSTPGYQPTWHLYSLQDSTPIQIGIYRVNKLNSQPNLTKAIITHDSGGWLLDFYNNGYFESTFDRINNIGGNNVVYADSAIIRRMEVENREVDLFGKYFPPDQVILDMANLARSREMNLTFMMGIYPGDALGEDSWTVPRFYSAISRIPDGDPFWDAWFSAYRAVLVERAALAQQVGATRFVLGFNLDYMINKGNNRWIELIRAVRSVGFTGKISYFVETNGSYNGLSTIANIQDRNDFIRLFDEIGLSFYNPVFSSPGDYLVNNYSRMHISSDIRYHISYASSANVPINILIGTPSVHSGLYENDYIEPSYGCSYFANKVRDYYAQADVYQAVAEIINEQDRNDEAIITGIYSWGYHYMDNPIKNALMSDVCYDFSASVRNKPAEAVLSYWFNGW